MEIYSRDVMERMIKAGSSNVQDFEWMSQLRFYFNADEGEYVSHLSLIDALKRLSGRQCGSADELVQCLTSLPSDTVDIAFPIDRLVRRAMSEISIQDWLA